MLAGISKKSTPSNAIDFRLNNSPIASSLGRRLHSTSRGTDWLTREIMSTDLDSLVYI